MLISDWPQSRQKQNENEKDNSKPRKDNRTQRFQNGCCLLLLLLYTFLLLYRLILSSVRR
jgi:hypothetical protein